MFFGSKKKSANGKATGPSPDQRPRNQPPPENASARGSVIAGPAARPAANHRQHGDKEARQRAAAAAAFAQIVAVLMHSPQHKRLALADLEWLVFPALATRQFGVAHVKAKRDGAPAVPAAVVLWASVSPEIDKKFANNPGAPLRPRPDQWKSGDILWLIDAVGDPSVVAGLLKDLNQKVFKDQDVKIRVQGKDGKPAVRTLQQMISASSSKAAATAG
jgi:cytolysin-activating lysine-acyltransferase